MTDRFGIERLKKVTDKGIRNVFTPSGPVREVDLLFDRSDEVERLLSAMTTPGNHAIIYGQRGVGKSSLAQTSCMLLELLFKDGIKIVQCDSAMTFSGLVAGVLKDAGVDIRIAETESTKSHSVEGKIGVPIASAAGSHEATHRETLSYSQSLTPSEVCAVISSRNTLLIIDEADAIADSGVRKNVAELMKLLSDNRSPFKVIIVGIAETASFLVGEHPSVERCLTQIQLDKLSNEGVGDIILGGFSKLKMTVDEDVVSGIIYCSDGFPHFAHLLCLKSGEEAISDGRNNVTNRDLLKAQKAAAVDSYATLERAFRDATRSSSTMAYRDIVYAACTLTSSEFTSDQLRAAYRRVTQEEITQAALNNYFGRLVSDDGTKILRRIQKGVYRFSDPRMAPFARIDYRASQDNAS